MLSEHFHLFTCTNLPRCIQDAARAGDLDKVRRLVAVADALAEQKGAHGYLQPQNHGATLPARRVSMPFRSRLMAAALGYLGYNLMATAYAYRITSLEANTILAQGADTAEATIHMRGLSPSAEMRQGATASEEFSSAQPRARRVFVLPYVYVSDMLFGRSSWVLTCRKTRGALGGTSSEWSSKSGPGLHVDMNSGSRSSSV